MDKLQSIQDTLPPEITPKAKAEFALLLKEAENVQNNKNVDTSSTQFDNINYSTLKPLMLLRSVVQDSQFFKAALQDEAALDVPSCPLAQGTDVDDLQSFSITLDHHLRSYHKASKWVAKDINSLSKPLSKIVGSTDHPDIKRQYPFKLNVDQLESNFGPEAAYAIQLMAQRVAQSGGDSMQIAKSVHSGKESSNYGVAGTKVYLSAQGLKDVFVFLAANEKASNSSFTSLAFIKDVDLFANGFGALASSAPFHNPSAGNLLTQLGEVLGADNFQQLLSENTWIEDHKEVHAGNATHDLRNFIYQLESTNEALVNHHLLRSKKGYKWTIHDGHGRQLSFKSLQDIAYTQKNNAEALHGKEWFKLTKNAKNIGRLFNPQNFDLNPLHDSSPLRRFGLTSKSPRPVWEGQNGGGMFIDGADDSTLGLKLIGVSEKLQVALKVGFIYPLALGVTKAGMDSTAAGNTERFKDTCSTVAALSSTIISQMRLEKLEATLATAPAKERDALLAKLATCAHALQTPMNKYQHVEADDLKENLNAINKLIDDVELALVSTQEEDSTEAEQALSASDQGKLSEGKKWLQNQQAKLQDNIQDLEREMKAEVGNGLAMSFMNYSLFPFMVGSVVEAIHNGAPLVTPWTNSILGEAIDGFSYTGAVVAAVGQAIMTGVALYQTKEHLSDLYDNRKLNQAFDESRRNITQGMQSSLKINTMSDTGKALVGHIANDIQSFLKSSAVNDGIASAGTLSLAAGQAMMLAATVSTPPTAGAGAVLYIPGLVFTLAGVGINMFAETKSSGYYNEDFRKLPSEIMNSIQERKLDTAQQVALIGESYIASQYRYILAKCYTELQKSGSATTCGEVLAGTIRNMKQSYDATARALATQLEQDIASDDQRTPFGDNKYLSDVHAASLKHLRSIFDPTSSSRENPLSFELEKQRVVQELSALDKVNLNGESTIPPPEETEITENMSFKEAIAAFETNLTIFSSRMMEEHDPLTPTSEPQSTALNLNTLVWSPEGKQMHTTALTDKKVISFASDLLKVIDGYETEPEEIQTYRTHKLIKRMLWHPSKKNAHGEEFFPYIKATDMRKSARFNFLGWTSLATSLVGEHRKLGRLETSLKNALSTRAPILDRTAYSIDWEAIKTDLKECVDRNGNLIKSKLDKLYTIADMLYSPVSSPLSGVMDGKSRLSDNIQNRIDNKEQRTAIRKETGGDMFALAHYGKV